MEPKTTAIPRAIPSGTSFASAARIQANKLETNRVEIAERNRGPRRDEMPLLTAVEHRSGDAELNQSLDT